jgi:hypothetical protein
MSTSRSVTIQFVYSTSHPPPCSRVLPRPPAKSGSPCIPTAGSTLRRCGVQFLSGKRDRASWSSVGRRNVRACRLVVWIIQREVSRNQHHHCNVTSSLPPCSSVASKQKRLDYRTECVAWIAEYFDGVGPPPFRLEPAAFHLRLERTTRNPVVFASRRYSIMWNLLDTCIAENGQRPR